MFFGDVFGGCFFSFAYINVFWGALLRYLLVMFFYFFFLGFLVI